LLNIYYKII